METNESIIGREVVALSDRKRVGTVEGLCVDIDMRAVVGFMVKSASTATSLVLPFEQALSTGNAFVTIEQRDDLLVTDLDQAKDALADGFKLVGVDVFSRLGDALGKIEGYTFDTTYGTVTEIVLDDESTYSDDTFVFFAADMIFINDGGVTADEMRRGKGRKPKAAKRGSKKNTKSSARKSTSKGRSSKPASKPAARVAERPTPQPEATPANEIDAIDKDAEIKTFLEGLTLIEDVISEDGSFKATSGTFLTSDIINEAARHDALLLLTLSVED